MKNDGLEVLVLGGCTGRCGEFSGGSCLGKRRDYRCAIWLSWSYFFPFSLFLPVSKAKLFEPGRKLANFISVGSCRSDSVANEGQLICYLP
jgi:hypothetical protein